jgi:hypothetical protein
LIYYKDYLDFLIEESWLPLPPVDLFAFNEKRAFTEDSLISCDMRSYFTSLSFLLYSSATDLKEMLCLSCFIHLISDSNVISSGLNDPLIPILLTPEPGLELIFYKAL